LEIREKLSENTVKYYRRKTEEEEVGEEYSQHLRTIAQKHEAICAKHTLDADEEHEFKDSLALEQLGVHDFKRMKKELADMQKGDDVTVEVKAQGSKKGKKTASKSAVWGKAGMKMRKVQGHLYAQLALAFMNRSNHYHHSDLFEAKTHESWMPAYQGVSREVKISAEN